jgi:hypothetical protein
MNEPNDGMAKKIEQVLAQIIVEQGVVLKGGGIRHRLEAIGIFSQVELDTSLIRKIQAKVERNQTIVEHQAKIARRESMGAIDSPTEATKEPFLLKTMQHF